MPPDGLILHNCPSSSYHILLKGRRIKENYMFQNLRHIVEKKNGCIIFFGMPEGKR